MKSEQRARLLQVLGVVFVAVLGLRSSVRNADWYDNLTLSTRDVATYPQGAHLNKGYALELMWLAADLRDPDAQRRQLQTAEQHLAVALEIDPAYADALALRARIRAHFADIDGAYLYAEAALLLEPHNHDALHVLTNLHGQGQANQRRLTALRTELDQRPDDPAVRLALGTALLDIGKPAAAREHLERAVALAPDNVDALRRFGQALAVIGRTKEAIEAFRRVLALDPDEWSTHANISSLLARTDVAAALWHAQRAHELQPNDVRAAINLAEVYEVDGQTDRSLELFRDIERGLDDDDPFRKVIQERIKKLQCK